MLCFAFLFLKYFFKKLVKTAVPEDGRPPRALVLTKLVEETRFEVGDEKTFFDFFCRVLCVFGVY